MNVGDAIALLQGASRALEGGNSTAARILARAALDEINDVPQAERAHPSRDPKSPAAIGYVVTSTTCPECVGYGCDVCDGEDLR